MKSIRILHFVYLLTAITIVGTACKKDWFDTKSDINKTVPSTLQDFEYLLDDFFTMNQGAPGLAEVGSDGHFMTESRWLGGIPAAESNTYIWSKNLTTQSVSDWNNSYKRIFYCNIVLEGLKKIPSLQEPLKYSRVKGNAFFNRAKTYYDLAQIYAQPYQSETENTDIGLPLKEGVDVTEQAKRSSVKITYDQILSDLHSAKNLLPTLPAPATRGSKVAVFCLLARTYLTMGDYVKAGLYADSSLSLYDKLIDFNTVSPTATNLGRFNLETVFYSETNNWTSTTSFSGYGVDQDLFALYNNDDLRKTRFFTMSSGRVVFKGNYTASVILFSGLAVDEQYLIRAECFAREGNTTAAMKDLNDLLKTRWSNAAVYSLRTANDSEDALRQILVERRKELLFRNLRWTDLRRLNLDNRFKVTLIRTIIGNTYTLEPGSYKYTLPIPDDILNLAPQMKQSPGWE